jgi:hexosaminidase
MRIIICFSFIFSSLFISAQQVSIVPQPAAVKQPQQAGTFSITPATVIVPEDNTANKSISFLNDYLQRFYQYKLKVVKNSPSPDAIRMGIRSIENQKNGAYTLNVTFKGIYINGTDENGLFYGIQSLLQLLPIPEAGAKIKPAKLDISLVDVEDAPRFAYRGMHLDVCRHFFPVSFIKQYIDYMAHYKFNTFHWHLTDDQGWRIEIKKYPKLTEVGSWRNGTIIGRYPGTGNDKQHYGGYYTQAEIKEVVKYAADRYITIVPEIEMPGHSSAAIAAYPQLSCFPNEPTLNYFPKECEWNGAEGGKQVQQTWGVFDDVFCAGNDSTFIFLENVLNEVLALFPSRYIHVGGDECPKENWKRCDKCQRLMKKEALADEHHLQSYFIQRIEKYLNNKGRTLLGWDEILEGGLAPNAAVMSWRGEEGGVEAARQKHEVVMTPGNPVYFDHTQSENEDSVTIGGYNSLEKVYAYDPIPAKLPAADEKFIMGAQANLWTEYITNNRKVEYMLFPRISALSEVLWSKKENKNWDLFQQKLLLQFKRYDLWKTNYSRAYFDLKATVLPTDNNTGLLWKLESNDKTRTIIYNKTLEINDPPNPPASFTYKSPVPVLKSGEYSAWSYTDGIKQANILTQKFIFSISTGKKITLTNPPSSNYPGDGAFTLVNGVQNSKGMGKTKEFLGFNGIDCEAVIDFGKKETINQVIVHCLHQKASWIWRPLTLEVFIMDAGGVYHSVGLTDDFLTQPAGNKNGTMTIRFPNITTNLIKVVIKNWGEIPAGEPGAGNKPWLFVDEIEVNSPKP